MTWTLLILTMAGDVEVSRLALSPGYETRWACEADVPIVADNVAVLTEGQHIEMVCDGPPVPRVSLAVRFDWFGS